MHKHSLKQSLCTLKFHKTTAKQPNMKYTVFTSTWAVIPFDVLFQLIKSFSTVNSRLIEKMGYTFCNIPKYNLRIFYLKCS